VSTSAKARRIWWITLSACAVAILVFDGGALFDWWEWPPNRLHQPLIMVGCTAGAVLGITRFLGPMMEAYRLGMSAGERMQRQRCAATCGHSCHIDNGHMASLPAAVGDDSSDNVRALIRTRPRQPGGGRRNGPRHVV
jgi:hypothetical protein